MQSENLVEVLVKCTELIVSDLDLMGISFNKLTPEEQRTYMSSDEAASLVRACTEFLVCAKNNGYTDLVSYTKNDSDIIGLN